MADYLHAFRVFHGILMDAILRAKPAGRLRLTRLAAWSSTPTAIADFLAEEAGKGGTHTRTLLVYVEADLNVSSAADYLFIHPNTAHYRLARIAEKTGLDPRNVSHLMELLVAVKLADESPS